MTALLLIEKYKKQKAANNFIYYMSKENNQILAMTLVITAINMQSPKNIAGGHSWNILVKFFDLPVRTVSFHTF